MNGEINKLITKKNGEPFNFYIIDDSIGMVKAIKSLIEKIGGNVLGYSYTGVEAMDFLDKNKEKVDIVTLDIRMPDVNGIDLIPQIKEIRANYMVVMISALSDIMNIKQAMNQGANYFIGKPFEEDQVFSIFNNLCRMINDESIENGKQFKHETLKAFLIQDSVLISSFLRSKLESLKCEVVGSAYSGADAIADLTLLKDQVDVVVMNLVLPDVEGCDLVPQVLQINNNFKIVIVSSINKQEVIDKALRNGAHNYISKPFREEELKNVIKNLFPNILGI